MSSIDYLRGDKEIVAERKSKAFSTSAKYYKVKGRQGIDHFLKISEQNKKKTNNYWKKVYAELKET